MSDKYNRYIMPLGSVWIFSRPFKETLEKSHELSVYYSDYSGILEFYRECNLAIHDQWGGAVAHAMYLTLLKKLAFTLHSLAYSQLLSVSLTGGSLLKALSNVYRLCSCPV